MNFPSLRKPRAFLPLAMSFAALALALGNADEGAAAHIFQLLMIVQVLIVSLFAINWLPRAPKETMGILALQAEAALAAIAAVFFLGYS